MRGPKRAVRRPLLRGGLAACAAAAACAAPAGAASVSNAHDPAVPAGGVTYAAAAGEVNHLTVSGDAASVRLGDAVAIVPVVPAGPVPPPPAPGHHPGAAAGGPAGRPPPPPPGARRAPRRPA